MKHKQRNRRLQKKSRESSRSRDLDEALVEREVEASVSASPFTPLSMPQHSPVEISPLPDVPEEPIASVSGPVALPVLNATPVPTSPVTDHPLTVKEITVVATDDIAEKPIQKKSKGFLSCFVCS